ncbi:DCC1-like thiol-disulfide oxidoreductase family protein [Helicobacter sp. 11S02596-1]|uniref:DCC1-like thiol-disulfide oxidoreductase family protein n=1 Tax=Helicobacter sp. 11S02596-1 TaxID=1476194 RepID=UPI000BD73075|nr:DCC1-like thiol-disulfide oxidoreductase family protein [Helicobacter sp. 11S02596-1]PAF44781.1 hypothetical protein BJI48_01985 [Helicobacter sp. 11S02596-1]
MKFFKPSKQDFMPELTLYYDGECPICKQYTLFLKIKKTHRLFLKDARTSPELKNICQNNHININDGMVLLTENGGVLQGERALLYLQNLDNNTSWLYRVFISKPLVRWVYPILKGLRWLLLKILGKKTHIE